MRERGFEVVAEGFRRHKERDIKLPVRGSINSAGYDFFINDTISLVPGESFLFWTDVKAYMLPDEVLTIKIRSSMGIKFDISLKNTQGVIDSDYYNNPDNDGNIGICLKNNGSLVRTLYAGDKVAQGIFTKYLITDNDDVSAKRIGGVGSTT